MKKILLSLLAYLLFVPIFYAADIGRSRALDAGKTFMTQRLPDFNTSVKSVDLYEENNIAYFYIINFEQGGWILVSASDLIRPVIGYSDEGRFVMTRQLPDNITGWFGNYKNEIREAVSSPALIPPHREWAEPTVVSPRSTANKVAPFITVKWNQSNPYNKFCPEDGGRRALVGCVAVAMAQAMSVYSYPTKPSGSYQYRSNTYGWISVNYDNEAPYDWGAIMTGANNREEVARLLYHCGVALDMDYGLTGSGTQSSYIARALKKHFGFPESVVHYSRANYTGDWKQLIVNELRSGRPVCYNGTDLKKGYGHCFNIDGYDGNDMFHVNWGWGGSFDGYFRLNGLKDQTMDMDYTAQQGAVVGMAPPSDAPLNITLSNSVVKEKEPAGTVVGEINVTSYATNPVYEFVVAGENDSQVPFRIADSKLLTTQELLSDNGDHLVFITATNTNNGLWITQAFAITVSQGIPLTSAVTIIYNKETKQLTIATKERVSYTIYSGPDEDIMASGELAPDTQDVIDTSSWSDNNSIQLYNASGNKTIKMKL